MRNKRLAKLVRNRPEKYPYELERQYGRVLERILDLWDSDEAEQNFLDLLVDKRGDRAGFPVKVAEEIFFLSELHALDHAVKGARIEDETARVTKADERARAFRAALEAHGLNFVPKDFFRCVALGDMSAVVLFVNAGMDVDTLNDQGWTPLMVALFEGKEAVALFLIRKGANPFFSAPSGYRPIHWAAYQGYSQVIKELIRLDVDVNVLTDFGWTPVMQAAARGFAPAVRVLAEHGAKVNETTAEGWTALHKACANGHREVVDALLALGALVDCANVEGTVPLHLATRLRHRVIVAVLLRAGADATRADRKGATPLHLAAHAGDVTLVNLLLDSGAKTDARDRRGATPLFRAVEAGELAVIRRLLQAGATIDEVLLVRSAARDAVAQAGNSPVGWALAKAASLVQLKSWSRRNIAPLHRFVIQNDPLSVRAEIENGADPNQPGPEGLTPLEIAAAQGNLPMWLMLVELGGGRHQDHKKGPQSAFATHAGNGPTTLTRVG